MKNEMIKALYACNACGSVEYNEEMYEAEEKQHEMEERYGITGRESVTETYLAVRDAAYEYGFQLGFKAAVKFILECHC